MLEHTLPTWLQAYVDACNRHDPVAVVALMSDDVEVVDTAFGGKYTGRAAVRGLLEGMDRGLSSDFRFTVQNVIESGGDYAFEWVLTGTHDRANPAMALPATGKEFAVPGLTIGVRTEGLISQNRDYWNVAGLLTQVGVMPRPNAAG